MKTLESEITEADIERSRKDFGKASLITHFAGEFALVGFMAKSMWEYTTGAQVESLNDLFTGIGVCAFLQIPATIFLGLSGTHEEHWEMAKELAHDYKEEKKKGKVIGAYITKKFAETHLNFAREHGAYDWAVVKYTALRKKLFH